MVSKNTEEAIDKFREVLELKRTLCRERNNLSRLIILIPEVEMDYYSNRINDMVNAIEDDE